MIQYAPISAVSMIGFCRLGFLSTTAPGREIGWPLQHVAFGNGKALKTECYSLPATAAAFKLQQYRAVLHFWRGVGIRCSLWRLDQIPQGIAWSR